MADTSLAIGRIRALLRKDLEELRRTPGVLLPSVLMLVLTTAMPLVVGIAIPASTGERLSEASDVAGAADAAATLLPALAALSGEARAQAFLLHQFFLLQLVVPMVGAMAIATTSVIAEKQARTLEPLLATPMSTAELLAAKTLGAFLPAVALAAGGLAVYVAAAAALAEPGAWRVLVGAHALVTALAVGPLASLAALLIGVIASSRVNDARTAQQFGVVVIVPITGLFLNQLLGGAVLGLPTLAVAALLLAALDLVLLRAGVQVFDRERILTRWS
jgi:ABC-2 type transport system permease protein